MQKHIAETSAIFRQNTYESKPTAGSFFYGKYIFETL